MNHWSCLLKITYLRWSRVSRRVCRKRMGWHLFHCHIWSAFRINPYSNTTKITWMMSIKFWIVLALGGMGNCQSAPIPNDLAVNKGINRMKSCIVQIQLLTPFKPDDKPPPVFIWKADRVGTKLGELRWNEKNLGGKLQPEAIVFGNEAKMRPKKIISWTVRMTLKVCRRALANTRLKTQNTQETHEVSTQND